MLKNLYRFLHYTLQVILTNTTQYIAQKNVFKRILLYNLNKNLLIDDNTSVSEHDGAHKT